jgi:uncharacterized repeat protein (TIGR02543 family)
MRLRMKSVWAAVVALLALGVVGVAAAGAGGAGSTAPLTQRGGLSAGPRVNAPAPSVPATPSVSAPTPPAPFCGAHRVLIAYADSSGAPAPLRTEILAEPGVAAVDFFNANAGTPTLTQLRQYDIVVPYSNSTFADATTLGNNLADYVDGGGVVVQFGFSFYGPGLSQGINGRWASGSYNVFDYSTNLVLGAAFTLGTNTATNRLMSGVTTLNSNYQNVVTPATGAVQVAAASNGNALIGFRPVAGGLTTFGVTGYAGLAATLSGHWGRVIVNAANWFCRTVSMNQNFDGVTSPALPVGWAATNASGPGPLWASSNTGTPAPTAETAPNAAFVDDPNVVSDKRLDTPSIPIQTSTAQLRFRQNRNLENVFDGGVLEVSVDGGAFQDIVSAGGAFVANGYNGTISSGFLNPLAGRQAWTGNSGGFVETIVNLPASVAGHSIKLRWRMGSDSSLAGVGWRIDTVVVDDGVKLTTAKAGNGSGTVSSLPLGVSCGTTCVRNFNFGTSVVLTASPATGSSFTGWSGAGCSGTGTCTVALNAAKSVTANFALQSRSLTVKKSGNGVGKVTSAPAGVSCPKACLTSFLYGTGLTLTATPSKKAVFSGWTGDCAGKSKTCPLSMTADHTATAKFTAKCVVPKLKGLTLKKARAKLKKAHCRAGKVTKQASTTKQQGRVLKQKPKPGKILKPSAKVNLTVGRGGL